MPTSRAGNRCGVASRNAAGSARAVRARRPAGAALRSAGAGFTLLEILITLSIMAVVTALAAPAIASRLLESPFDRSARVLKGMLQQAHAQAAVTGQPVSVLWSPETRRFVLQEPRRMRGLTIPQGVEVNARGLTSASAEDRVPDMRSGIVFYPLGGSTGGVIGLRAGERTAVLSVDQMTGSVEVTINR